MQFFVYFTTEQGSQIAPPSPEGMARMGELMQEGIRSGVITATGQLPATTMHIRLNEGQVSVEDGPLVDGKQLIPGFTVIRVGSTREAIEWATRLRRCMGDGELRVAPVNAPGFD